MWACTKAGRKTRKRYPLRRWVLPECALLIACRIWVDVSRTSRCSGQMASSWMLRVLGPRCTSRAATAVSSEVRSDLCCEVHSRGKSCGCTVLALCPEWVRRLCRARRKREGCTTGQAQEAADGPALDIHVARKIFQVSCPLEVVSRTSLVEGSTAPQRRGEAPALRHHCTAHTLFQTLSSSRSGH